MDICLTQELPHNVAVFIYFIWNKKKTISQFLGIIHTSNIGATPNMYELNQYNSHSLSIATK